MARTARAGYVCQNCGSVSARWTGKCAGCGEWNTLVEETDVAQAGPGLAKTPKGRAVALQNLADAPAERFERMPTGLAELDRVTGGGIVPGSALLIGGEPGIGKSTLLLQVTAAFALAGRRAVYFTGEEASTQVRLRAERLGLGQAPVQLASETSLSNVLATLSEGGAPHLVVVDSIQTLWAEGIDAAPGTVSQVRMATQALVRFAKQQGTALLLVGHVTKDGQIAGPKVIEHMVDTVLYFEGDRGHPFRILRAAKNRFGATDEIGVFEMAASGLREVANPSELFLGERLASTPGSAVFAGMEGTRPILVELQALVVPSGLGTPRRAVVGWDSNRLAMILAVLDARCGVSFAQHDVYLNVAGGLRITEPAADLAAAAALLSSISNLALGPYDVYFGEISLSGAVRPAGHTMSRLKEARKLGFKRGVMPAAGDVDGAVSGLDLTRLAYVKELAHALGLQDGG
ncbi:MAG TPA: DNA repair protein RadA [Hyphomicrobiaceae bacterium]|jgi:DNA repair protein RadA/Sms|nr:DNA repair protein RadA [Hyphomicrobiaceae bacterium]